MFFRRGNPNFKQEGSFLLARVRTDKSGEIIPVRLSKTSELSLQGGGYFVRKTLIGSSSLDQAVHWRFHSAAATALKTATVCTAAS